MTTDNTEASSSTESQHAVGSQVDRGVGRLEPERAEDRVLLGLAGAAVDCGVRWEVDYGCYSVPSEYGPRRWNPLNDDGDALRLAVKTGLAVVPYPADVAALHNASGRSWAEMRGEDTYAATRRAIVRAAAALGAEKTPNARAEPAPTAREER